MECCNLSALHCIISLFAACANCGIWTPRHSRKISVHQQLQNPDVCKMSHFVLLVLTVKLQRWWILQVMLSMPWFPNLDLDILARRPFVATWHAFCPPHQRILRTVLIFHVQHNTVASFWGSIQWRHHIVMAAWNKQANCFFVDKAHSSPVCSLQKNKRKSQVTSKQSGQECKAILWCVVARTKCCCSFSASKFEGDATKSSSHAARPLSNGRFGETPLWRRFASNAGTLDADVPRAIRILD